MTTRRAALASALALLVWCAAGAAGLSFLAGVWPAPDPGDVRLIGFHEPDEIDGRRVSWTRHYSKIGLPDRGWRPLRVIVDLHAPPDADLRPFFVELGTFDNVGKRVRADKSWRTEEFVIRDAPTGPRIELQIWSTVQTRSARGVGVGRVRQTAVLVSRRGAAMSGAAVILGLVAWTLTSRSRRSTAGALTRLAGPMIPGLLPGAAVIFVGFVPMLWLGFSGWHVWWLWASLLTQAAFGRLLRVLWLQRAGEGAVFRDPIVELALGLSGSVSALYVLSFLLKRVGRYTAPIAGLFPLAFVAALLTVWVIVILRQRPIVRELTWSKRETVKLAAFFLFLAWLAGPHLTAVYAYSSDPLQHIGWTNQLRVHGFVPDDYADTGLLISYPLGFASYAYVLMGMTPLAPGNGVNVLPVLASAIFIYAVVFGVRALQEGPRADRSVLREVGDFLIFAALATIFSSAQFGMWHYFEGTGRSSASLVHLVPLALLVEGLYGLQYGRPRPDRPGPRLALLLLSGILVLLINPGQLLVHGVTTAAVLLVEGWSYVRFRPALVGLLRGAGGSLFVGAAMLLADPYWYRAIAHGIGLTVSDAHIQKVDADFLQRFREPACLRIDCITRAFGQVEKVGTLLQPIKAVVTGPIDLATGALDLKTADHRFIDMAVSFPPPAHGLATLLQVGAPLVFLLTMRRHRWPFVALIAILLVAAGTDLTIRKTLGLLIGPGDPTLRLLPPYAARASSVFFNQTFWTGLTAGVYFPLARATAVSKRWAPALVAWCGLVGTVWVTASVDLRAEAARVAPTPAVPTLEDLRDFWALEPEVPPGESYLVSARVLFGNNERYVDPIDEAVTLYAQADRPTLFQFFQSYGAQYTATDFLNVCEALKMGVRYPAPIARHRARWVVMLSSSFLDPPIRQKWFCDMPVPTLFPGYEAVARRGRLTLYRLW